MKSCRSALAFAVIAATSCIVSACGSDPGGVGGGGNGTGASGTGGNGTGGGTGGGDGGSGGEKACRFAYLDATGLPSFEMMVAQTCTGNCATGMNETPLVVADTPGDRRVFFPAGWAITEAQMDTEGKLTQNAGRSEILVAMGDGGFWHVYGDHGNGHCQSINQVLSLSPAGGYGLSYLYGEGGNAFLFSLSNTPISPPTNDGACGASGQYVGSAGTSVSQFSAAALVADATCRPCPTPMEPPAVSLGEAECTGYYALFSETIGQHLDWRMEPQRHFMVDAQGHELLVAGAGTLAVADLAAHTGGSHSPLVPKAQVAVNLAGQASQVQTSGAVTCPAGNVRISIVLGPARGDHVVFVSASDGATTSPVVALDLGPDGTSLTASGPLTGFPQAPPESFGANGTRLVGPWMLGGKRLAFGVHYGAQSQDALEVWDVETTGVTKLAEVPLTLTDKLVDVLETSSGVFAVLQNVAYTNGTYVSPLRILSLGALAAGKSGDRPLLDGPLAGGVDPSCSGNTCALPPARALRPALRRRRARPPRLADAEPRLRLRPVASAVRTSRRSRRAPMTRVGRAIYAVGSAAAGQEAPYSCPSFTLELFRFEHPGGDVARLGHLPPEMWVAAVAGGDGCIYLGRDDGWISTRSP